MRSNEYLNKLRKNVDNKVDIKVDIKKRICGLNRRTIRFIDRHAAALLEEA